MLHLLVILLVLPFIDLYILIETASFLGFFEVLALILLTGAVGAWFIRREAETVLARLGTSVTAREVSRNVLEASLIVLGGIMLLSPGFITDIIGFILVYGRTRTRIAQRIERSLEEKSNFQVRVGTF